MTEAQQPLADVDQLQEGILGQQAEFPAGEPPPAQEAVQQPTQQYQEAAHEQAVQQTHQSPQPPTEQAPYDQVHQHLLYAQQDPHHLAQVHQQEHHPQQPGVHHEAHHEQQSHAADLQQQPHEADLQHQQQQASHIQHDPNVHPASAGIVIPHPASFAQQLMEPHLNQQQLAQYHQQLAQFQPHAYQQQLGQYHPAQLQELPQLYFAQGIPPQQLQAYQDAAGVQDGKLPDMSIDEAAAAHLTALRNTGRPEGQMTDGQAQVALGQPPMGHPHLQPGLADAVALNAARDAYVQPNSQALLAGTAGRVPSKRKAWRASHEGQGAEGVEQASDGSRSRRKQTRRPDRLCHHEGCFVTPTYNYPNEKKRIFCVTHKLDGMVNVVAKRCAHPDCAVNPRFNYEGNTRGMYCSEHKLEGMVNVIDRRCQEPDCKKFPSHNYPGSHKKLYCATHKKEGMVDMSHGSN